MESVLERQLLPWQLNAALWIAFAAAALLLASAGVFATLAQNVVYRTREIGIRLSLGATETSILQLILGLGMQLVLAGILIGLGSAFLASRALSAHLYEISPTDPISYAVASVLIAMVGLIACYLPARRAANLQPSMALRQE